LGYFLAERGEELDRAEELIRQALMSEPENAYYLDSLGWVQFQRGDYEAAYATLRSAQENGLADDPTVLEHVAEALFALQRSAEAVKELRRAIERDGDRARLSARIDEIEKTLRERH
jgi:predicted Zn-dependent protease